MFSAGGEGGITQNRLVPVLTRRASRLWRSVPNALRLVEPKSSHRSSLFQNKQKSPHKAGCFVYGGEGGIRTLDTLLTYTPLAGERLQPLGHFSRFCLRRFSLVLFLRSPVARYSVLCTSPFGSPSYRRRSFAVLDCSVSHSAPYPDSSSFSLRSDPLPPPLPRCG